MIQCFGVAYHVRVGFAHLIDQADPARLAFALEAAQAHLKNLRGPALSTPQDRADVPRKSDLGGSGGHGTPGRE